MQSPEEAFESCATRLAMHAGRYCALRTYARGWVPSDPIPQRDILSEMQKIRHEMVDAAANMTELEEILMRKGEQRNDRP